MPRIYIYIYIYIAYVYMYTHSSMHVIIIKYVLQCSLYKFKALNTAIDICNICRDHRCSAFPNFRG